MNYDSDAAGDWSNEDTVLPDGFFAEMPRPTFWRVMVMPLKPKEVSRGGIVLAKSNQDAQAILGVVGRIIACGPLAGVHERLGGDGKRPSLDFPHEGDYVIYGRYAGQPVLFKDKKFILINDDELLGVVPNPDLLKSSV